MAGRYSAHYSVLTHNRDHLLGNRDVGRINIDCRSLARSQWGLMEGKPIWILRAQLQTNQSDDHQLKQLKLILDFRTTSTKNENRRTNRELPCPLEVTEYYGPQVGFGRPLSKGVEKESGIEPELEVAGIKAKLFRFTRKTNKTYTYRWRMYGLRHPDKADKLYRQIDWTIEEATSKVARQIEHRPVWELGMAIKHDNQPFFIHVGVSAQVKSWKRIFSLKPKRAITPTQVIPRGDSTDVLDNEVLELNKDLTDSQIKTPVPSETELETGQPQEFWNILGALVESVRFSKRDAVLIAVVAVLVFIISGR
ncbi:hypothetical protein ASPCAL11595 [Aspergillus calidoustus]|uniref:Uncharacterized protein n=1 Tax=Aspergillus calidoustus TaxID=454130 RepID=A0A0U5GBT8_ASPCI|nr:hypothetical protein ASPCAL11595 [Aspergillus calidoustus]